MNSADQTGSRGRPAQAGSPRKRTRPKPPRQISQFGIFQQWQDQSVPVGKLRVSEDGRILTAAQETWDSGIPVFELFTKSAVLAKLAGRTGKDLPVNSVIRACSEWNEAKSPGLLRRASYLKLRWDAHADKVLEATLNLYGPVWPGVIYQELLDAHPDLGATLRKAGQDDPALFEPAIFETLPEAIVEILPGRRFPAHYDLQCPLCGAGFNTADVVRDAWRVGPPRFCRTCCWATVDDDPARVATSDEEFLEAVKMLAAGLGELPTSEHVRRKRLDAHASPEARDLTVAALILLGARAEHAKRLGGWTEVLRRAGLIGETWRPSRGTYCVALDGHPCRSLAEKAVDDFLHNRGLAHEIEPDWPFHPTLHPQSNSPLRADWRLTDGTYVEMAGMGKSIGYEAKMERKGALAAELGIRLVLISTRDLGHLTKVFASWLPAT